MSDNAPAPASTKARKRRIVSLDRIADGVAYFDIYERDPGEDGKQAVAATQQIVYDEIHPDLRAHVALLGVASLWSNRYTRLDNPSPADVLASLEPLYTALHDGTWTPGRAFEERDPTDLELAVAEATGTPVADIMDKFDNTFEKNADGTYRLDKKGRRSRVYTKSVLDGFAGDSRIKPILARIVAERAKRLAADAKRGGSENSVLNSLFAPDAPAPVADAAN